MRRSPSLVPLERVPTLDAVPGTLPRAGRRRDRAAGGPGDLAQAAEVDLRHRHVEPGGYGVGEFVVALETAAQPAAPGRNAAAGVQFEGRLAAVECRGDVIPRHLQEGRALHCGITAAAEGFL